MSGTRHVVLTYGAWGRGELWAPVRAAFEERGYTADTPTLRHHELPLHEGALKIAPLSMRDYPDDLVALRNGKPIRRGRMSRQAAAANPRTISPPSIRMAGRW